MFLTVTVFISVNIFFTESQAGHRSGCVSAHHPAYFRGADVCASGMDCGFYGCHPVFLHGLHVLSHCK